MPIQVDFQYDFPEYRRGLRQLNRFVSKSPFAGGRLRKSIIGWSLFIALAVLLVMLVNNNSRPAESSRNAVPKGPDDSLGQMLLLMVPWLLIFGFAWIFVFLKNPSRKQFDADRALHDLQSMTLDSDGVHHKTFNTDSKLSWSAFDRVESTSEFLFLFTRPNMAFMIPARAFADSTAFQSALEMARPFIAKPSRTSPILPAE